LSLNAPDQSLDPETVPETDINADLVDVAGMMSTASPETVTLPLEAEGEPDSAAVVENPEESPPLINLENGDASPAEIPDTLGPGHHHVQTGIDDFAPFGATNLNSNIPAEISLTLAPDQPSPPQVVRDVPAPEVHTNLFPGVDEPFSPPTDDENADPLPVIVTDGLTTDGALNSAVITDTPMDTVPRTRFTLMLEARALRSRALTAERERDRLEAERRRANEEGRRRDSILHAGDRDEMAAKAAKYRERAAERFHLGTFRCHVFIPACPPTSPFS
jgi:hypothetical protein